MQTLTTLIQWSAVAVAGYVAFMVLTLGTQIA